MKRYDFYCSYDGGGPAEEQEDADGGWVRYEDAARLAAEVERLRVDAERYRWLRQFPTHFATDAWGVYGAGLPLDRTYIDRTDRLDAAIDAAMKEQP